MIITFGLIFCVCYLLSCRLSASHSQGLLFIFRIFYVAQPGVKAARFTVGCFITAGVNIVYLGRCG